MNIWIIWKNYVKGLPKRTNDVSKVKNSANKVKRAKVQVTQHGSDANATSASVPMYTVPHLDRLCEEAKIQAEVQNRVRQLADNAKPGTEKIKSQRGWGWGLLMSVSNRVKWPHKFVLSGQNKDRVSYNQLSPIRWMVGFCRTIREESNVHTRENMLDYVINLLKDAKAFSWSSAKACHAVLLFRMEQGE